MNTLKILIASLMLIAAQSAYAVAPADCPLHKSGRLTDNIGAKKRQRPNHVRSNVQTVSASNAHVNQ